MNEDSKNDSQETQPDQTIEQDSGELVETVPEPEVDPKIGELEAELEAKDKRIADLSSKTRDLKKEAKKSEPKQAQKRSDELDYGQKAYLNTKEIAESEHEFVADQLRDSGLELNELLDNGYFKSQLQSKRDAEVVKEATPGSTRGATEPAQSKVQHWMDKGELPPDTPENRVLRAEVVNARIEYNSSAQKFSTEPIVEG